MQVGLEGCVSVSPSAQDALAFPLVKLGERVLRVHNSPFWPHLGSVCIHQTPSSSSLAASTARNQNSNLLGRLAVDGIRSTPPQGSDSTRYHNLAFTGVRAKQQEVCYRTSQSIEFLGFTVESRGMTLSLPMEKIDKIRKECRHTQDVTGRQLVHIIGLTTSVLPAVLPALLHYRALQRLRVEALGRKMFPDYDKPVKLSLAEEFWK